jgi:hypothetical protein
MNSILSRFFSICVSIIAGFTYVIYLYYMIILIHIYVDINWFWRCTLTVLAPSDLKCKALIGVESPFFFCKYLQN